MQFVGLVPSYTPLLTLPAVKVAPLDVEPPQRDLQVAPNRGLPSCRLQRHTRATSMDSNCILCGLLFSI